MSVTAALTVLEHAIADVGVWRWWTEKLPDVVQLEFAGVQLYVPPRAPDKPPANLLAMRFVHPSHVSFLRDSQAAVALPRDWPERLRKDELDPLPLKLDAFTLSSAEQALDLLGRSYVQKELLEPLEDPSQLPPHGALACFLSGPAGILVLAESFEVHTLDGPLQIEDIEPMHQAWWAYWREYWLRKDSSAPLPVDYACEVTVPLDEDG
jgi:hypothetical protein